MAWTKGFRTAREAALLPYHYLRIARGDAAVLNAICKPAPYLRVLLADYATGVTGDDWFTILGGMIVSLDTTTSAQATWIVPCNGNNSTAAERVIPYGADDVDRSTDIDVAGYLTAVAASGDSSTSVGANFPIGFAAMHQYAGNLEDRFHNYTRQFGVSLINDEEIEMPLLYDTGAVASGKEPYKGVSASQTTIDDGRLVACGKNAEPVLFVNGTTSVEQIVGRCLSRHAIAARFGLDKVSTFPGSGLPGTATGGIPLHLYQYVNGTTTYADEAILINVGSFL